MHAIYISRVSGSQLSLSFVGSSALSTVRSAAAPGPFPFRSILSLFFSLPLSRSFILSLSRSLFLSLFVSRLLRSFFFFFFFYLLFGFCRHTAMIVI